jgi:NADH-quinone oxidoreductase subunit I
VSGSEVGGPEVSGPEVSGPGLAADQLAGAGGEVPTAGRPVNGDAEVRAADRPAGGDAELRAADLPARSRGVIGLLEENCTVCMLCARECPDWCIYIESHKEPVPGSGAPGQGRARVRNALDRFAIDFSLCMYCGICVEVCPYDALFWSPEYAYPAAGIAELTHEQDRLREWMWTVPPPPEPGPGAPPLPGAVPPSDAARGLDASPAGPSGSR